MFCRAISDLMKFNTLIHLLMKTLAGGTVGRMKSGIVTICTSAPSDLAITVRTCKPSIKHNLLQTLAIFPLEISDKRIIPLPIRETIFLKLCCHISIGIPRRHLLQRLADLPARTTIRMT